ncbi:MAG: DUF559 domain-containing protein [Gammaproteobacteria bacterium]|nr:MAG: DUF559 domain-containing protein [Gammaproteobacteria bacterium]
MAIATLAVEDLEAALAEQGGEDRLILRLKPGQGLASALESQLAQAASKRWPLWCGKRFPQGATLDERLKALSLAEALAPSCGIPRRWLKAALQRQLKGALPLPPGFPTPVQVKGLARLLDLQAIVLVQETPLDGESTRLLQESGVPAVRLVPKQAAFSPGLPHPQSPAEQRLARAMAKDPQLAGLFLCNQPVETTLGHRYVVDFLWPSGRLAVEVDGYRYHSSRVQFALDRQRDYELQLSGYRVLRLTHDEVMGDVEAALAKVRRMVECLRGSPP